MNNQPLGRTKKSEEPLFNISDRGFNVRAYYLENTEQSKGDALIELRHNDQVVKQLTYPAYKIWNIAAHFRDIVDSEIADDDRGYQIAGHTGFGVVMPEPLQQAEQEAML